jgi:hypothetical protein
MPLADLVDRARLHRQRAAECRESAENSADPFVQRALLALASSYDLLALNDELTHRRALGSLSTLVH